MHFEFRNEEMNYFVKHGYRQRIHILMTNQFCGLCCYIRFKAPIFMRQTDDDDDVGDENLFRTKYSIELLFTNETLDLILLMMTSHFRNSIFPSINSIFVLKKFLWSCGTIAATKIRSIFLVSVISVFSSAKLRQK